MPRPQMTRMHPICLTEISIPYLRILRQYFDRISSIDLNRINIRDPRLRRKLPKDWKDFSDSQLISLRGFNEGFDAEEIYIFHSAFQDLKMRVYGWFIIELWSHVEYLLSRIEIPLHACKSLPYYREVNIVRLMNNVLKHGDGRSYRELKELYPGVLRIDDRRPIKLTKKEVKSFIHTTQSFLIALERHLLLTKK